MTRSSSSSRAARLGAVQRCPAGSARRSAPGRARASVASAPRVLGARVAVAEVAVEVEASAARPAAPVSATASGWSAKRAAIACGVASTCAWLPRRSGSDASSVVCSRMATNASCSGARARACAWTLPVATRRHPEPPRERRQPAVARAVVAGERALQLDAQARRARRRRSSRRSVGSSRTPWCAQPVRQTRPSRVLLDVVERTTAGGGSRRAVARRACARARA